MENNRYNNSSIYKKSYFYIGSTCNPLSKRLYWHKYNAKKQPDRKVYKYFNSIGWDKVKIVLIEEQFLDNKQQLLREEDRVIQMYIDDEKCLNSIRALITPEEARVNLKIYDEQYYEQNKDAILERQKLYREKNKDLILEKGKIYHEKNKEVTHEKQKQYYEENKDVIQEKRKQYREKHKEKIQAIN